MLDLRAIHDFIASDSRFYARKVVQEIQDKTAILDELPRLGKKVPELDDGNVRELSLYSYRIIYETRDQEIYMLAVTHKRRDMNPGDNSDKRITGAQHESDCTGRTGRSGQPEDQGGGYTRPRTG